MPRQGAEIQRGRGAGRAPSRRSPRVGCDHEAVKPGQGREYQRSVQATRRDPGVAEAESDKTKLWRAGRCQRVKRGRGRGERAARGRHRAAIAIESRFEPLVARRRSRITRQG